MTQSDTTTTKMVLIYILAAYVFSFAIRMIWIYQFHDVGAYHWGGQLMINTNDGYYFGAGAQKFLEGTLQHNPRVPDIFHTAIITITAFAAKFLPVSLDTAMLYMPAVISSFVVIPIILIGRLLGNTLVGFLAALVGAVAWSYYNRTMVGYFDTDMFSAMAPMFILYFLLGALQTEKIKFALFASLAVLVYPFLYDQGRVVVYAMGLMYMGYMFLFHRKDSFTYNSILLISIGLLNLQWGAQLIAIGVLFVLMQRNLLKIQHVKIASIVAILGFLYFGNVFHLIWMKVALYFSRGVESEGLKFYQVSQTVREAGIIPFDVMANRISGSIPGVLSAFVGYLMLVVRHRPMILALPLIGIGVFSLVGGLRFTVYAVPVAALSSVYLFYFLAKFIENRLAAKTIMVGLTALLLYPNIRHVVEYKVPTVFNSSEVEALDQFSKMGSDKDYVVTWWDYGYPIWYYGNKNTLIDGGKHNHDNFIVSEILTSTSQLEAARLSRIAVETYLASNYATIADTLFHNGKADQLDPNTYLEQLKYGDAELPEATRDVYLYLPLRMLDIFPTVAIFSRLDLNTGTVYRRAFYYATSRFNDTADHVNLGRGIVLDKRKGVLRMGQTEMPVQAFYTTKLNKDGSVSSSQSLVRMDGRVSVIFMASYRKFLVVDNDMLNTNFIQMFVLGNYDHDLFESVLMSPFVQIYKLKV